MKRYRLVYSQQTRSAQRSDTMLVEDPNGEWVRYQDVHPDQPQTPPEVWVKLYENTHDHGA
jgi:hypothetical protein